MIRALISDFGGVLTSPLAAGFLAYQEEARISLEDLGRAMQDATEAYGEHPLYALERGEISEQEFARRLAERLHDGFDLGRLRELYFELLEPNAPMIAFIGEQRGRGLRTALLTNNVREWEPLWRAKLPELDEIFEVVVDSAFVGMRKPEPRIYELTVERLGGGLRAEDCLFLDDIEVNCDAARALGMTAVHFQHADQAIPGSSQLSRSRARSDASSAARERATLSPWWARQLSQAAQEQTMTSAARSGSRSSAGMASSSRRKTRSTSAAFACRAVASQPATELDSCSISTPARRTPPTRSYRRARCRANCSMRSASARLESIGTSVGTTRLYCSRATASRSASRSGKCWNTERSDTPARAAISAAVGFGCPSSSRPSRASTSAWRVRSARTVRPSRCSEVAPIEVIVNEKPQRAGWNQDALLTTIGRPGLLILETRTERKERSQRL